MTFRLPLFERCAIAVFSLASLCLAQRDPGVRGGPAGAGAPLRDLSKTNWRSTLKESCAPRSWKLFVTIAAMSR